METRRQFYIKYVYKARIAATCIIYHSQETKQFLTHVCIQPHTNHAQSVFGACIKSFNITHVLTQMLVATHLFKFGCFTCLASSVTLLIYTSNTRRELKEYQTTFMCDNGYIYTTININLFYRL